MFKINDNFYKCNFAIFLYISFGIISNVLAEAMQVTPGLWETKSYISSPGGEHENVTQECIDLSEISPEKMMDDTEGCEVTDSNSDSNSMQWAIRCVNQGITMMGKGHAQSSGDSITGGMDIQADFNGQEVTMKTKWEGKRIGNCK